MTTDWPRALRRDLDALISGRVTDDESERRRLSTDLSPDEGALPDVVASVSTVADVIAVVQYATDRGLPLYPRGGGMSFTSAYVPQRAGGILLDTTGMERLVTIDRAERFVVVEAGMTWQALLAALQPTGLRTPYWGPFTGAAARIGATVSQNSAWWGSARYGTVGDSLLGLEVVTAGGRLLRTGGMARDFERPFFRYHGPDLTGLFIGDNGSLGVKTKVALRLIEPPGVHGVVNLAFEEFGPAIAGMDRLVALGLVADVFCLDTFHSARLGARGYPELAAVPFTMMCGLEARSRRQFEAQADQVRRICEAHGGRIVDTQAGRSILERPFDYLSLLLVGPEGQVSSPVMGVISYDRGAALHREIEAVLTAYRPAMLEHGVAVETIAVGLDRGVLVETLIFWADEPGPVRSAYAGDLFARYPSTTAEAARPARALVSRLRDALRAVYEAAGCFHFQLGRFYRTESTLDPEALNLLRRFKRLLDPTDILNPGVLGL